MSCGRTTTRRQAHAKRRTTPFLGHTLGSPGGSGSAVTPKGRRVAVKKKVNRRSSTPAWLKAWEKQHPFKFNLKAFQAWERRHPFKDKNFCHVKLRYAAFTKAQQAAWDKAHPFKPWTEAQWQAWFKSHPLLLAVIENF